MCSYDHCVSAPKSTKYWGFFAITDGPGCKLQVLLSSKAFGDSHRQLSMSPCAMFLRRLRTSAALRRGAIDGGVLAALRAELAHELPSSAPLSLGQFFNFNLF
jgi:hypothetical protein